ncbi:unnamed protein product [Chilo suppressalis]|uniref:Uncharacterized protein n=1 Tax=Chilo suppressalis TaxID=168631 RepID=A0ABN8B455_CHISP|nr:hypothetical protein evm_012686 [Chilo suppressalis]CAH0403995.1 unnamed protein product [Chilo suppressalis]
MANGIKVDGDLPKQSDEKPKCNECGKMFSSKKTFRYHLNFSCAECGKRFLDKRRLREHVDWEHLQKVRFRCQLCHKAYKSHTSLYVHMQNLHRDKKKDNLCHICGKSYQNAAKLKYHIVAMHTSETPYTCGQCGAAFGWYSSLYRHTREVHHKIKLQPKKSRKQKRDMLPSMLPTHDMMLPHQPGPA